MTVLDAVSDGRLNRVQWEADGGIRLELVGTVRFPKGHRGISHSHPFWELIFIGGGIGKCEMESETVPCVAGDILVVPPGEKHRFQADADAPLHQHYLGFSCDFALEGLGTPPRFIPRGPFLDLIRSDWDQSLDGLRNRNSVATARGRLLSVAGRVIASLQPAEERIAAQHKNRNHSPIRLAQEILNSDLKCRYSVPDLAHRFCLSSHYFGEKFKRDTGMSVKEYQRECRLERAMTLLRDGTSSISEVAAEVGLKDLAYFSRLFKKKFGVAPTLARSRLRATPAEAEVAAVAAG